jgi:hypothetical protein
MKIEITVKRPTGDIEIVTKMEMKGWTDARFEDAKKATREAGRGELLSYKNIPVKVTPPTDAEIRRMKMKMYGTMSESSARAEHALNADELYFDRK